MRRHLLSLFTVIALAAGGGLAGSGLLWTQSGTRIVIAHTTDIHGQVLPKDGVGGMAEMATLLRRAKPDLILDGGDMFTGTMLSDEFMGKPLIEIMNRLHYDAVALGNHELDYGLLAFKERAGEARFPILSANIQGLAEIKPYTILNVKGVRVGVIGLTTEELRTTAHPKNLKTLDLSTLVHAMEATLPAVRRQSDFIILLTHLEQDEQIRVARAFPEVKLIISGHPHAVRTTNLGGTTIVEAGSSTRYLGVLELRLAGKVLESITEELLPVRDVPPDPEIDAIIEPYREAVAKRSSEKLGDALQDLLRSRTGPSPLSDLVADGMRAKTGTPIAIHNLGGIRSNLLKGPITFGGVFEVLPFSNTVVTLDLTGAQLKSALNRLVLAVSGLRVVWDSTKPAGSHLLSAVLADGSPLQDEKVYRVTTNDFVQAGGDGLVEFTQAANVVDTGSLLREVISDYIRHNPAVSAHSDGRVTVLK